MVTILDSYIIREARADDKPALVKLLEEHYFPREYLKMVYYEKNKHKIDDIERKKIALDLKDSYIVKLANHPSLIVVHNDSKEIVGISIMVVEENPKFAKVMNTKEKSCVGKSTPIPSKFLAEYLTYIVRPIINSFDVFAQFPSYRKALNLQKLCVNPQHSGHGLATNLIKESIRYAENNGCGLIFMGFLRRRSHKKQQKGMALKN